MLALAAIGLLYTCMEIIYNLSIFLAVVSLVVLVAGLIKPKLFKRFLGAKATRKNLAIFGVSTFLAFTLLSGFTEPESIKLARIEKEKQAQLEKDEKARQEQLAKEQAERQKEEVKQEEKSEEPAPDPRYYWHEVLSVVDGDTVKARVDGRSESIRIIGIDSPENSTECFGNEATSKATEFLSGKWIQLEKDNSQGERDKYGRLLRYVWFDTGTDFGRRMIEEGYAHEYTYNTAYSKQAQYKETYEKAKAASLGLWSTSTCSGQDQKPSQSTQPAPQTTAPAPTPKPATQPTTTPSNCDPNYTPCVPKVSYDLDCADIGFMVRVIGSDPHKFDGNHDGYGCESYQ